MVDSRLAAAIELVEADAWSQLHSAAGVREFVIQRSPSARPDDAMTWFSRRQATVVSNTVKVYRTAAADSGTRNTTLTVEEIGPERAELYEQIVAEPLGVPEGVGVVIRSTIGQPGWHYYLAFDQQRAVAGGASYIDDRYAWFGLAATQPQHRQRGAQTALLERRLNDAAAHGCEWVSADTLADTGGSSSQSLRNMHRAGFALLYERPKVLFSVKDTDPGMGGSTP